MSTSARINGIEQIETALRTLEAYGYDTSMVWSEHNDWQKTLDTRKPTELDATWATRNEKPSSVEEHFIQVLKFPVYADNHQPGDAPVSWREVKEYGPELLSAANCFVDRHYTLTSGMRDTLRERHGLTPAKTIIITHAPTFPGTNILWQIAIKSAEHVDPRRRKHVLVEAVITHASEFFKAASERDKEREAEKAELADKEDKKRAKQGLEPISVKAKALQYY